MILNFYDLELAKAADTIVREPTLVGLKPGDDFLIYADTETDMEPVWATARAAYVLGAKVAVIWYPAPPDIGDKAVVPRPVSAAMANSDVILEFATKYLLFSKSYDDAVKAGVRYVCLTGMATDMIVRTIGKVNWPKMIELGRELCKISNDSKGKTMRIATPTGTDVRFQLDANFFAAESVGHFAGEVGFAPFETTINGTIVLDGTIQPPTEIGLLRTPIELKVEKGRIVQIKGGPEAKAFERWLAGWQDPNMYNIAHFSYGFNPCAKRTGNISEDERVYGGVVVGIGHQGVYFKGRFPPAKAHSDGTMLNASIWIEDEQLEKDGKYVHPRLLPAQRELGI